MKRHIFTVVFALTLQGCVTTLQMQPIKSSDQVTQYQDGAEMVISTKTNVVGARAAQNMFRANQRPSFVITVYNRTKNPFDFSTENISARSNIAHLKVFTHEELVEEVRRQHAAASFMTAFAGAMQSYSASMSGNQYYSGRTSSGTYYSGRTYNPAIAANAQAIANANTERNMQQINESAKQSLGELARSILKRQTVMPDTWHGGYIVTEHIRLPDNGRETITLGINIGDEAHTFTFLVSKVERK